MARETKIYWYPARLIEDPLTGETLVLMYGGSGRVRYVRADEIQAPVWDDLRFKEKAAERAASRNK